jgi:hypothetical protein
VEPQTERGLGGDAREPAERGEVYDAVNSDDLGAEWLARATESMPTRHSPVPEPELTFDLIESEPISDVDVTFEPELELDPDAAFDRPFAHGTDRDARAGARQTPREVEKNLDPRLERPRPPPHVFDVGDVSRVPPVGKTRSS